MLKYTIQDRLLPTVWDIIITNGFPQIFTSTDPAQDEPNVADQRLESTYWTIFIENGVFKIESSPANLDQILIFDEPSTEKQYRLGVINGFLRCPQVIILSTDSILFSLASSSSSSSSFSSSSSSSQSFAGIVFGEENPTGELPITWQTWKKVDTSQPSVVGSADWGKVQLAFGEQILSPVSPVGESGRLRTFTLLSNKYGFGLGNLVVSIRGSDTPFDVYDVIPAWETYTVPVARVWSYVQARLEGA